MYKLPTWLSFKHSLLQVSVREVDLQVEKRERSEKEMKKAAQKVRGLLYAFLYDGEWPACHSSVWWCQLSTLVLLLRVRICIEFPEQCPCT